MYGLINILYDEPKQRAFELLYMDSDDQDRLLLRATIAEALKDCPKLISSHGSDFVLCTLSQYNKNEEETMRIFQGIMRCLNKISFGLLTNEIEWKDMNSIADESLVGISFFRRHIERMNRRRAAPSVEYYSRAGALAFHRLGYDTIGENFLGWTSFIEKEMAITSIT